MTAKLFESALGITPPWLVAEVDFDETAKVLTVQIDFAPGSRFAVSGHEGLHPVHDTVSKTYRHLNFFQHECHLRVRTPRVKLPNGSVRLVEPEFARRLNGFTLLFEALILMLARQMPFAAVARIVGESPHRVLAVCDKYVEMAAGLADYSEVTTLAIDETSRARGHSYVTLAADAQARRALFVTEGRNAQTIAPLAEHLADHGCPSEQIEAVSIDMSPAFIAGVHEHPPNARITFDKFHVIAHAAWRWTRCAALSSAPTSPSRGCAGRCSRIRLVWASRPRLTWKP
jgi:transposase